MDKRISMFSGGRLKVVALLCVFAVLALPALAFASGVPTTSSKAAVHLVWSPASAIKTLGAKIAVGGVTHTANVAAGGLTADAFALLGDGAKTVVATGKAVSNGALVTESWTVTVNEAPKIGASIPGNGQVLTAAPAAIIVKYSDNTAAASATATVNGAVATVTFGATQSSISAAAVVSGVNTVVVTVKDAAGNASTKTFTFMVNAANAAAACTKCHSGAQIGLGSTMKASGHNTTENGVIGGKTKFDGSQGVTLKWIATTSFTLSGAKTASATDGTSSVAVAAGSSFTTGQAGVMTSNWALPTKSVFWPATDDGVQNAPSTAIKGLTWTSVITCENCHTAFNATGPHGSSANAGLDTAYPADYSMAMLSKKVTSGSSFSTTNTAFAASGIAVGNMSLLGGTPGARTAGTAFQAYNLKDGTTGSSAVICAKCHRLEQVVGAGNYAVNGVTQTWPTVIGANTAHNSHHQDTSDGTAQCVSCHVGITHGWKAPRLLVDVPKYDGTPFVSENMVEEMGTIAGLNNHPLVGSDGWSQYSTGSGASTTPTTTNTALAGTVLWDESQCDACGDHYGNLHKPAQTDAAGIAAGAVPVRINF